MTNNEWYGCNDAKKILDVFFRKPSNDPSLPWVYRTELMPTGRKLRLFTVAACMPLWADLDSVCRNSLRVAERMADGKCKQDEWTAAQDAFDASLGVTSYAQPLNITDPILRAVRCTLMGARAGAQGILNAGLPYDLCDTIREIWDYPFRPAAMCGYEPYACTFCHGAGTCVAVDSVKFNEDGTRETKNPRPEPCMVCQGDEKIRHGEEDPCSACDRYRTPTVMSIANQIYDEHDFGSMPVLADALEEAGCQDVQILRKLRAPTVTTQGTNYIKITTHCRGGWVLDAVLGKE